MRCVCAHPSIPTEVHVNLLPRPKQSSDPSIVSRFCFKLPTLNLLNTLVHGLESSLLCAILIVKMVCAVFFEATRQPSSAYSLMVQSNSLPTNRYDLS